MRTSDFEFELPPELIAQQPALRRDQSRLLVLRRDTGQLFHRQFPDLLEYLRAGDVLVLNNSKVIPARLRGANARSGGKFELLLLDENALNDWWAMIKPGKRARIGTAIHLQDRNGNSCGITATITDKNTEGHVRAKFSGAADIQDELDRIGEIPLPPYIERIAGAEDWQRYQTVYARTSGSVAAPTAGLHFTPELLDRIQAAGVRICYVTLHVGLGTFAPVKTEHLAEHVMHSERYEIPVDTAKAINEARASSPSPTPGERAGLPAKGSARAGTRGEADILEHRPRIIAVGTTSVRVLESAARNADPLKPTVGATNIFLHPPCEFRVVDALLTNFHLPRSTLLMLVSAFAAPGQTHGRDLILNAYREAVRERYRFFSYGDAMLML